MDTTNPNQIRLEITTGDFQLGTPGVVSLYINGSPTPTDINGAAAGTDLNFVWDAEGEAYMGFSRNSSPTLLSIDNLKISVPSTFLPGDFDMDGDVDGRDFLAWQRGNSPNPFSGGDLAAWQAAYGPPVLVAVAAVPEPTSLGLAWIALIVLKSRALIRSRV
jgi:hypothetical protein